MNEAAPVTPLQWRNVEVVPLIHGRLPFALHVRERMLETRFAAVAVELPPSLGDAVLRGVRRLPEVTAAVYRERAPSLEPSSTFEAPREFGSEDEGHDTPERGADAWYVPIDPCDGMVEALRIADRERTAVHFVDADVEDFVGRALILPDPHVVQALGLEAYYQTVQGTLRTHHPATNEDRLREGHMAARLLRLHADEPSRPILFLCGMAHWERIHDALERNDGREVAPREPSWIDLVPVGAHSLYSVLGETPYATWQYEQHRSGIDLDLHDPIQALKSLLLEARDHHEEVEERPLLRATAASIARTLDYVRRLTLSRHRLTPDLHTLIVAAKGVVGNDYALSVLEVAGRYPPNEGYQVFDVDDLEEFEGTDGAEDADDTEGLGESGDVGDDPWSLDTGWSEAPSSEEASERPAFDGGWLEVAGADGWLGGEASRVTTRTPGAAQEFRRVSLERPPPADKRREWKTAWNPHEQCSWPPEDVVIENLRAYVSSRSLSLAGLDRVRTEEFQTSLMDGLALRETLRDPQGKLQVRVEPRVPGRVGAVVLIFEEDDAGTRFPWRATWHAEHAEESTLAFYATSFTEGVLGPGVARARYGGCMMIYPPVGIPDVWDDPRFERARRPSERLLLAAAFHSQDRFVAYVSATPPSAEARATLAAWGQHVIHLPLSSFSARTLEKVRTVHVLNGQQVRSWASRFIR